MRELPSCRLTAEEGLQGAFRSRPGNRQITVLTIEGWRQACAELGVDLPWTTRRANLLVEGISLADSTGSRLRIGDAELAITGETEPCRHMDEYHKGLQAALSLNWRGGVCCRVNAGDYLRVGAEVELEGV